jgi:hypothetical protein
MEFGLDHVHQMFDGRIDHLGDQDQRDGCCQYQYLAGGKTEIYAQQDYE